MVRSDARSTFWKPSGSRPLRDAMRAQPPETGEVFANRLPELDTGVGIFDPTYGNVLDPIALLFGQDQQLGVEEPLVVLYQWDEHVGGAAADRFESALGVAEARPHHPLDDQVVRA